ncbi:MAG TPA: YceI family protein [Candidatus Binatus sp.]|jgi:polyisoprenoid-binding protein YceI|nr:YceI family protein [Candidatus Binatus sp.]
MRRVCILFTLSAFSLAAQISPDPAPAVMKSDSKIEFHASATFAKVTGVFHSWDINLKMPTDKFDDASLDMQLEAESVATGSGLRDKEVKGKNFFDVKQYPQIHFVSKTITPDGGPDPTKFLMNAELTLRGITQLVSVALTVRPSEKGHQFIDGEFTFNRRDFGMTHNAPLNKVANNVQVQFHLHVANTPAPVEAEQLHPQTHP